MNANLLPLSLSVLLDVAAPLCALEEGILTCGVTRWLVLKEGALNGTKMGVMVSGSIRRRFAVDDCAAKLYVVEPHKDSMVSTFL